MGGPALLFENVKGSSIPVAVNLLGTMERVVWSMGLEKQEELEDLGKKLALLQQPRPPKGFKETKAFASVAWDLLKARPDIDLLPPCHQKVIGEKDLDLNHLPLLRPWPEDAGGAITLGLVITKDPETGVPNVGVYRLQRQSAKSMTVHWLSVRGGARHLRKAAAMNKKVRSCCCYWSSSTSCYGCSNSYSSTAQRMAFCRFICRRRCSINKMQNYRSSGTKSQ